MDFRNIIVKGNIQVGICLGHLLWKEAANQVRICSHDYEGNF